MVADEPPEKEALKFEVIDNPLIPEAYASKVVAVSFDGGVVAIIFGATRAMPTPSRKGSKEPYQPPIHVTARLALAPGGAVELANPLNKLLNTLIQIQKNAAAASKSADKAKVSVEQTASEIAD
jgi:hypothetical protein